MEVDRQEEGKKVVRKPYVLNGWYHPPLILGALALLANCILYCSLSQSRAEMQPLGTVVPPVFILFKMSAAIRLLGVLVTCPQLDKAWVSSPLRYVPFSEGLQMLSVP